ncbi:MAG: terminase small subunit [Gammaproteobacteria bacterium]|nr:terminase small subunit [Gammaproteobacteria bacterium]
MKSSNYLRQAKRRKNRSLYNGDLNISENDQIVGIEALASVLDTEEHNISNWIKEGMPVEQEGSEFSDWIFNYANVKNWLDENGVNV